MGAVEENSVGLLPDEMKEEMMRKATSSMNIRAVEEKENKTKSAAISTKMKAENGEGQRSVKLGSSDRICNDVAVKLKELILQPEEDRKNIIILQDSLDKLNEKIKMYKRQLEEQESISNSNILRVKKFQRELESAENRAEEAESTLNQFRSRERVFASASARSEKSTDVQETEVVVKKTINKVNIGSPSVEESPSSALASRGRPCRLRCWCRLLLKSGLGGQSGFHLQGVEQGQGCIYGQVWLLRQHLQRTGSQAEGDDQPVQEGRPRLQGSRSGGCEDGQ